MFLAGMVSAAYHFRTDLYSGSVVGGVLYRLGRRLLGTVVLNYVFAWMSLRWKSIIPAGIMHAVVNMFILSEVSAVPWQAKMELAVWAAVAVFMFCYWMPPEQAVVPSGDVPTLPEPVPEQARE